MNIRKCVVFIFLLCLLSCSGISNDTEQQSERKEPSILPETEQQNGVEKTFSTPLEGVDIRNYGGGDYFFGYTGGLFLELLAETLRQNPIFEVYSVFPGTNSEDVIVGYFVTFREKK